MGPAIPTRQSIQEDIITLLPQSGYFALNLSDIDLLPDLSNSPASTTSSATSPSLDDDEIKRVFSQRQNKLIGDSYTEDLNPRPLPFVPGSPLVATNLLSGSPYTRPPGLPHPPGNAAPLTATEALADVQSQTPSPPYLSFLLTCLRQKIKSPERAVMARIIISIHDKWDVEQLFHLAENICLSGCESHPDIVQNKELNFSCHPLRYYPAGGMQSTEIQYNEEVQKVELAALLAAELHRQLIIMKGEETAQTFAWSMREVALMQFIDCWDSTKPSALTYPNTPSPCFVRSSLLLSQAIAAFYKVNLIGHKHISMCISILLKDMMSVEHVEAVCNIVKGCGQNFWESGDMSEAITPQEKARRLNAHVHEFITGMHANYFQRNLQDHMSVVDQSWSEGQLLILLEDIVNNVRLWERTLIAGLELEF